jgi:phosphoserine phosphatase RsbU/P
MESRKADVLFKTRLQSLLQITQAINSNFSQEQLLRIFSSILKNQLEIKRFAVYTQQEKRIELEVLEGAPESWLEGVEMERYLEKISDPQEVLYLGDSSTDFFQVLIPVFHKDLPLAFLLLQRDDMPDRDDLNFVQALTNIIFVAFQNKKLARENIQQERLRKELELASQLQTKLLPQNFQGSGSIEVDAFYKAHTEVGGDYFDFFKMEDGSYAICMADVSGKGVSAALLMSNFQANVRALFNFMPDLCELARTLNEKVMKAADGEKFITAFLGRYFPERHELRFVNCGHNPPLFAASESAPFEWLKTGSIGLGMLDELPFVERGQRIVSPGGLLVTYTDGLTELQNSEGVFFGVETLKALIEDNRSVAMRDLITRVVSRLETFKGKNNYMDDIAFLGCRFH